MEALFSIDARPDAAVQRQVQRGDTAAAARKQRKRELRAREHKLARSVFADEGSEEEADDDDDAAAAPAADADADEFGGEDGEGDDDGDGDGDDDGDDGDGGAPPRRRQRTAAAEAALAVDEIATLAPAWVDEDDGSAVVDVMAKNRTRKLRREPSERLLDGDEYGERLRAQFRATAPETGWAGRLETRRTPRKGGGAAGGEAAADAAPALLQSAAPLLGASAALPADALSVKRLADLNTAAPSQSVVQAIGFHPNGQLALTAGFDKTLRLFRPDGLHNPKVQSVHLAQLPIASACFDHDGGRVLLCGKAKQWSAAPPARPPARPAARPRRPRRPRRRRRRPHCTFST